MKSLLVLILLSFVTMFPQDTGNEKPFSKIHFGIYGGINTEIYSDLRGSVQAELKTPLLNNLYLKASAGYFAANTHVQYSYKNFQKFNVQQDTFYYATLNNVYAKDYDVFPFSLGMQYIFKNKTVSPYILSDVSYNIIRVWYRQNSYALGYKNFEDIPAEFKVRNYSSEPDNSYSIGAGAGVMYSISPGVYLDLRYFYKADDSIIDTHQFMLGVTF